MSITRSTIRFAMSIMAVTFAAGAAVAQTAHILVPVDKVQWGPAPPILPAGAQIAVLEGNPAEKGPIVMRLKLPANYNIPAHWHSMNLGSCRRSATMCSFVVMKERSENWPAMLYASTVSWKATDSRRQKWLTCPSNIASTSAV